MVILEESVNLIIMMEVSAPIKSDYLMAMLGDWIHLLIMMKVLVPITPLIGRVDLLDGHDIHLL